MRLYCCGYRKIRIVGTVNNPQTGIKGYIRDFVAPVQRRTLVCNAFHFSLGKRLNLANVENGYTIGAIAMVRPRVPETKKVRKRARWRALTTRRQQSILTPPSSMTVLTRCARRKLERNAPTVRSAHRLSWRKRVSGLSIRITPCVSKPYHLSAENV